MEKSGYDEKLEKRNVKMTRKKIVTPVRLRRYEKRDKLLVRFLIRKYMKTE